MPCKLINYIILVMEEKKYFTQIKDTAYRKRYNSSMDFT